MEETLFTEVGKFRDFDEEGPLQGGRRPDRDPQH